MPQITKTLDGVEYVFGTIKIGDARRIQAERNPSDPTGFNIAFIAASLRAGGLPDANVEYVEDLPFYCGVFDGLLAGAFEANGIKLKIVEKPSEGEDEPALEKGAPAMTGSTSDTSTEASADGTDTASPQSTT